MTIRVDSLEYKCWHEVGHATVCLSLGGDVDFIEFLVDDARGYPRARCIVTPEMEKSVACGGFAAEFYLLKNGYAEQEPGDDRNVNQIVFHNATGDREDFWGRRLGAHEAFAVTEDTEFMHYAIGVRWHRRRGPNLQSVLFGDAETSARALRSEEGRRQAS